jgi:hypothetical protein
MPNGPLTFSLVAVRGRQVTLLDQWCAEQTVCSAVLNIEEILSKGAKEEQASLFINFSAKNQVSPAAGAAGSGNPEKDVILESKV